MYTILLVLLILMLLGALPAWPYSRSWGYYPSGGLGLVPGLLLVCAFCGWVPVFEEQSCRAIRILPSMASPHLSGHSRRWAAINPECVRLARKGARPAPRSQ